MRYFILAGEVSGDLHGSYLMKALLDKDPEAEITYWGGNRMHGIQKNGQLKHIRDLAFMGFSEVIQNLGKIRQNFKDVKSHLKQFQPDAIILIDYPGFNLRLAKWADKNGFRVFYYISPQVWAWKSNRVKTVDKYIEQLYVILPFEKDFYAERGVDVTYVGHPLVDIIDQYKEEHPEHNSDRRVVALLPGSREQEVKRLLPLMMEVVKYYPDKEFEVAGISHLDEELYKSLINQAGYAKGRVKLIYDSTYSMLGRAEAAIVTSGTATLETAIFGVPEVVCYIGSKISYTVAKRLVKVPYISLVNLIAGYRLVPELIQREVTGKSLADELSKLLKPANRDDMRAKMNELRGKLKLEKPAADSVAEDILIRLGLR
jgi:lipid-A-disaccharide synthase